MYILDNFNRKIFIYDSLTGNFKNSVNINFIAWDMAAFENGDFIFAFSPMKGGELNQQQIAGRVFITDNNFNVKNLSGRKFDGGLNTGCFLGALLEYIYQLLL